MAFSCCHCMQILPNTLGFTFFSSLGKDVALLSRKVCLSVCVCDYRQCGCLDMDEFCVCAFVFTYWSRDSLAHMTLYQVQSRPL
jgi:hypothetical protein